MSGISSKALKTSYAINKKGYNGNELQSKEFSDGSGLELYDFNARTYDQQIGRFIQIDPESEEADQEGWSPYHFGYNNPIRYSDPDGKIPIPLLIIAAKFIVGAAIEYGSQVYDNYKSGKTGAEAWKPQSWGKIGLNGATSTIDPSGGVVKKIAINTATNVVESVGGQLMDGNGVSLKQTVTDVAVMTVSSKVKVDGSKNVSSLEQTANRLERVADNNPKPSRFAKANDARDAANNAKLRNEAAGTATTEATESAVGKKANDVGLNLNRSANGYNPSSPRIDNTHNAQKEYLKLMPPR